MSDSARLSSRTRPSPRSETLQAHGGHVAVPNLLKDKSKIMSAVVESGITVERWANKRLSSFWKGVRYTSRERYPICAQKRPQAYWDIRTPQRVPSMEDISPVGNRRVKRWALSVHLTIELLAGSGWVTETGSMVVAVARCRNVPGVRLELSRWLHQPLGNVVPQHGGLSSRGFERPSAWMCWSCVVLPAHFQNPPVSPTSG